MKFCKEFLSLFLTIFLASTAWAIDEVPQPYQGGTGCESPGTIAELPTTPLAGTICLITNGSSAAGDCTTTGSNNILCCFTGSIWTPCNTSTGNVDDPGGVYNEIFTASFLKTVTHGLGQRHDFVQLFDSSDVMIVPSVSATNSDNLNIEFIGTLTDARVIAANRGSIAYYETFTATSTRTITHNLGQKNVHVILFDSGGNQLEPSVTLVNDNSLTLTFSGTLTSARAVVANRAPMVYHQVFTSTDTKTIEHGLGKRRVQVWLYDSSSVQIVPTVTLIDQDNVRLDFVGTLTNARVVIFG